MPPEEIEGQPEEIQEALTGWANDSERLESTEQTQEETPVEATVEPSSELLAAHAEIAQLTS